MTDRPRVDIVNFNFFDWDGESVLIGGAERYVLELARVVGALGAQPRIVQNANRFFSKVHAEVPVVGWPAGSTMDLAAMSVGFAEVVQGAALVIASPVELATRLTAGVPVIGINHGIHWDYPNNRLEVHDPGIERRIVDAVLACDACVAVDTNFGNWLRCLDADAAARARFIPNFVDLAHFHPAAKRFDAPRVEVLFPRRLCIERGFRDVVAAFDTLLPRHDTLHLHLCGSGPDVDETIARAFVARHRGRVRWSKLAMDEMPAAYATSHVVLVPTVCAEGTSLSCIEAMATNNAVVTTPVGGLPNLVIDGHNGIVVPPGAKGLVEAIERLLADRTLMQRLARNGLAVAAAFSRTRWAARWTALIHEHLPERVLTPEAVPADAYAAGDWPHTLDAQVEAARAAQTFAEQQLAWRDSELAGIKSSTGRALLQFLYRIRFALFPRESRRERAAKSLLHHARSLRQRLRSPPPTPAQVVEPAREPNTPAALRSADADAGYTIVCLPILEWTFRFQRPQQLARQFARTGHDVLFASHQFGARLVSREVEPRIEVVELPGTPGTNPYKDAMSAADAQRMADALVAHLVERGAGRIVCLVQLPFWAPLAERLRDASGCDVVYDCMDLHAGFSSNTAAALGDEERLLAGADLVVCSSQQLIDYAASHARRTALVRNGVDYEHFAPVPSRTKRSDEALTVGYYGAIADWFDSALVAGMARLRPRWRIVLIGSTWSADLQPLEGLPNVIVTGEKPYAELPALIEDWDCCIIPFLHTPLTAATNPVKVYEMLAAGKPVVSVGLPELLPMADAGLVAIAEGPEAFVAAIEAQAHAGDEDEDGKRRAFAAQNTWKQRAQALADAIAAIEPEVSIIVVTFNNRELNALCLASLFNDTDYAHFEVIVVDNASQDGTPDLLRDLAAREPRLRIVLNADNRGFAAANNQGAAIARGRYLCFLNNDTVVHGAWLRTLVGHLRARAHLGLVGPVTNAIGNEAQIPVGYDDLAGMPAWVDAHCAQHRGRLTTVSMLAFFCVAMPRWTWRVVGPLDERFGTGMFEDDDYNRRVRAAGFDVGLAWDSFVHHWQRASFKLLGEDEYLRIYRDNQARYAAKWTDGAQGDVLQPLRREAERAAHTVVFAPSVGWGIHLAQRPHHVARVLAREGCVVVFDCSNAADDVDTLREVEPRLFLYKGPPAALAALPRIVLWTFSYNYDYRDAFPRDVDVVYDWIDDLSVFPYEPRKLQALHERAMAEADVVVSVARQLHERAVAQRLDARYVPNGVEEGRFEREPEPNPALADPAFAEVLAAGRPVAGYYGALASWFDYPLLEATARHRPDWSFVLIGPDHDGSLARSNVASLPNVYALGPRPYPLLPGYLHRFDVATIPFAINPITLATSPLKLYEYFAAGKPVISTPMPECAAYADVRIVDDAGAFSAALDAARNDAADPAFRARLVALAVQNTWRERVRQTMGLLERTQAPRDASEATEIVPDAVTQAPEDVPPAVQSIRRRFASRRTPANRCFFDALTAHLAGAHDDPCLPMYVDFALSANDRGRKAAESIEAFMPLAAKRALDVGCAYGGFVVAMTERGADATGFDVDAALLALAQENFRDVGLDLRVHLADITNPADIAGREGAFDIVTCNDVIEHVADPAAAIRNVSALLRPGGVAYFEIPNRDVVEFVLSDGHYQLFGIAQLEHDAARRYYADHAPGVGYGVGHYLRLDQYRALFEACGLAIELLPDAAIALDTIRQSLDELRRSLDDRLAAVPEGVRDEVRSAVRAYLDEAQAAAPATDDERRRFVERYGVGFWRIVARKSRTPLPPVAVAAAAAAADGR